uniref:Uncharacterized protein n=1 Tax=Kalanchoe fedtschenkoi TaxID=63787 RepID=A0A7N0UVW4_KALFE
MLCACSGEQFKLEDVPQSPESLATRDYSASSLSWKSRRSPESIAARDFSGTGVSSTNGDLDAKFDKAQVDDVESTLKEALSLNYEEARALLGRLEFQRGNYDAALHVFQGIDIKGLAPKMTTAIFECLHQRKPRSKADNLPTCVMSMHSVSLLLEAVLLKAKSLQELGKIKEAAKECKIILDTVEPALPGGLPQSIGEDCKLQEMFHKALKLLPKLWVQAGVLHEAISAYRRALAKPWNLDCISLASVQKDLASMLLYGGVEVTLPPHHLVWGLNTPKNNIEEAILLLFLLMENMALRVIDWDQEIMDHLTYALSVSGTLESLAKHLEQALPRNYSRAERWYYLALCYNGAGQTDVALNLLMKLLGRSEEKHRPHIPSLLFGAKLCSQDLHKAHDGIRFAQKVIDATEQLNSHFLSEARRLLGICYGNAAWFSVSDSKRVQFQQKSLVSLKEALAISNGHEDPELMLSLALENAMQRNLSAAFDDAIAFNEMMGGTSGRGWKLLALVVSAEQRFSDAETLVELALEETERLDQLELLRLKAVLQVAQQQPKQAIDTYRLLLALIESHKKPQDNMFNFELEAEKKLELKAWQDLAGIYTEMKSWINAKICADQAKSIDFYSPRSWHAMGLLLKAQSQLNEALVAFSISLSIEPDYVPSIVSTAEILINFGNQCLPIARSLLMNALRLEPTNHVAWLNLGIVAKMEGSFHQAADFFQAAYELKMTAPLESFL